MSTNNNGLFIQGLTMQGRYTVILMCMNIQLMPYFISQLILLSWKDINMSCRSRIAVYEPLHMWIAYDQTLPMNLQLFVTIWRPHLPIMAANNSEMQNKNSYRREAIAV